MATYAIGDVHGCFATLERLVGKLPLDERVDRLWMVGDLVNRGPRSLEVLRWARERAERLGERFAAVLGNHDLRLLALAAGLTRPKRLDTLEGVLAAPDGEELVGWLGSLPVLHEGEAEGEPWLMVHAGLRPEWTVAEARAAARRAEGALRGPARERLLVKAPAGPGDADPELWSLREELAAFTLLRTLNADGERCDFSGPLDELPAGCVPWFRVEGRRSAGRRIVCGHWAALGLHREQGVLALDSAVVWGRKLTAVRLDDGEVFQQETVEGPGELPPR